MKLCRPLSTVVAMFSAGVLLGGCGSSEPTPVVAPPPEALSDKDQQQLLPFAVGNKWVYTAEETVIRNGGAPVNGSGELTWQITNVEKTADGEVATCEMTREAKVVDRQKWLRNAKGFYQLDGLRGSVNYSPPQPIVLFPVKKGARNGWKGSGPTPVATVGPMTIVSETLGAQDVDTASDRVSAFSVQSTTNFSVKGTPGMCVTVCWMKPGVGIVRYRSDLKLGNSARSLTLRLKSSTVK